MRLNIHGLIDNGKCYEMVRHLRWKDQVGCPHCHATEVIKNGHDMANLGQPRTRLYKTHSMVPENLLWAYSEQEPNPYQVELDLLFDAIRNDKPYNEGDRACAANYAALLARAAINTSKIVTWDEVVKSELKLSDIDTLTFDSEPPVKPNADGSYPYAIPGQTEGHI